MIVVTGGAGFIGSALVWQLNQNGITDIIIVDNFGPNDKYKNIVPLKFEDVFDKDEFGQMTADGFLKHNNVETVYHLGACSSTSELDCKFLFRNNYEYSKFLCQHALQENIRFIYASSAATYGDGSNGYNDDESTLEQLRPLNPYGYSKHLFDLWVKHQDLIGKVVGLKFFNVYGPNEYHKKGMRSVVNKCFWQVKETGKARLFKSTKPDKYKNGEQKRDFIYVKDAVDMTLFFGENKIINGIYNIGTGAANTFNDFVKPIFSALGKKENIEYIDMDEVLVNRYQNYTKADIAKIKKAGYDKPFTPINKAVEDYIGNYLNTDNPYLKK